MTLNDAPQVHRLWTESQIRRRMWKDDDVELERTIAMIERSVEFLQTRGVGLWCAYARDEDLLIGFCGFWFLEELRDPLLSFGMSISHSEHGFATEIARAVLRHGFQDLGFPRVLLAVSDARSRRMAKKLGFGSAEFSSNTLVEYHTVDVSCFRDDGSSHRLSRGPQPLLRA